MKLWAWMTMWGVASVAIAWAAVVPPPPQPVGAGGLTKNAVTLKKLDVMAKQLTPQFQVTPTPPASKVPRYWYQMTVHFDTHMEWTDDLDFWRLKRSPLEKVVAGAGIEPATQGFSVLCSTD